MQDYTDVSKKLAMVLFGRRFLRLGIIAEGPAYDEIEAEVARELKRIMDVCYQDGKLDKDE